MADRGAVGVRPEDIDKLIKLYHQAYADVVRTIKDATVAGKIRKFRVMQQINAILAQYGDDVQKWAQANLSQYYLDGANVAQQDLKELGVDVTKRGNYAVINQEAIAALVTDMASNVAEAIRGMSRNASNIISAALRQQLNFIAAEGKITGEARRTISDAMATRLSEQGIKSLTDNAGREWDLATYTRMLARTKAVEARNQGLGNRMLTSGYDLVQVSNHNSKHPACAKYESKILTMTGQTPVGTKLPGGYVVFASYQDAVDGGLFHPNCEHAINVIVPSLAAKTKAYDNPYNKLNPAERAAADKAFRDRKR